MICKDSLCIELKSNLICGSGEGWGNIVDSDSTHDEYGFPYIPARRIKGLIKEAAMELEEFELFEKGTAEKMFGTDNTVGRHFVLYNAVLENVYQMKEEINHAGENEKRYLMPVNVNNYYTTIHYHTAIDEDGIVKEHSLRSVRAIDKGFVFYAPIEFEDEDKDKIVKCLSLIRHMGVNRTRGYGEVKMYLKGQEKQRQDLKLNLENDKMYSILLKMENRTNVSVPATNGLDTLDYITGASLLGFFANRYLKENPADKEFYRLFLEGGIKFENAYISDEDWKEYIPARQSVYRQKTGNTYYDKSFEKGYENEILSKVKDKYISGNVIKEVKQELVYHHRRPEDKSIGHVVSNENQGEGMLYQREVISSDQRFTSRITGMGADLKKALLNKIPEYLSLGSSRTIQYGNVKVEGIVPETEETCKVHKGEQVVCTLLSPVAFIDEKGESIVEVSQLEKILHLENPVYFVDYTEVGGYNAKWKLQKPSYIAFAKGSCVTGKLKEDVNKDMFLGNFQGEGLGHVRINKAEELPVKIRAFSDNEKAGTHMKRVKITKPIVADGIKKEMRLDALEIIKKVYLEKTITPSLLGRLLKMLEKNNWNSFEKDYLGIANDEKKDLVKTCVENIIQECDVILDKRNIFDYVDDDYKFEFYIQTLKDLFTQEKVNRREA